MKNKYTKAELQSFNDLRDQGCAVCVFLPSELGEMSTDTAEEIMCSAVNDQVVLSDDDDDDDDEELS